MIKNLSLIWTLVVVPPAIAFTPESSHSRWNENRRTQINSLPNALDTLTSGLASITRLPYGVTVQVEPPVQQISMLLYDVENNRDCREIRERITELDIVVTVVPAGPNSRVFKEPKYEFALRDTDGKASLPRLVVSEVDGDERILTGKADILSFFDEIAPAAMIDDDDEDFKRKAIEVLSKIGNFAASYLRYGRGTDVCSAASPTRNVPRPTEPLILYSYEGNQFCRLVREVLTELDIYYELRSAGKESPRRKELSDITGGSTQCPYMIDPNTNTKMPESADIIAYLYRNYALWTPPDELLQGISQRVLPIFKPLFSALTPLQAGSYSDDGMYAKSVAEAKAKVENEISSDGVVIYTYSLSPFSSEATKLLDNLNIDYKEISLGMEWLPGLLQDPLKRAALFEMTGQSSLPHIFVDGKHIGGLFSGTPGLVPALEKDAIPRLLENVQNKAATKVE